MTEFIVRNISAYIVSVALNMIWALYANFTLRAWFCKPVLWSFGGCWCDGVLGVDALQRLGVHGVHVFVRKCRRARVYP